MVTYAYTMHKINAGVYETRIAGKDVCIYRPTQDKPRRWLLLVDGVWWQSFSTKRDALYALAELVRTGEFK